MPKAFVFARVEPDAQISRLRYKAQRIMYRQNHY
jgi:hypothetical protein